MYVRLILKFYFGLSFLLSSEPKPPVYMSRHRGEQKLGVSSETKSNELKAETSLNLG